jgi:hypothetical protein
LPFHLDSLLYPESGVHAEYADRVRWQGE